MREREKTFTKEALQITHSPYNSQTMHYFLSPVLVFLVYTISPTLCSIQAQGQVHWYLYLSTISTAMKVLVLVLKSFLCFCTVLGTCTQVLKYFKYLFIKVNPTQVHVEGSLEPHSKKSKTLFSFMHDPETETTHFRSHSNTDDYLAAPCVFMDTNPAKYQKENRSFVKLAKILGVPSSSSPVERLFSNMEKFPQHRKCLLQ